MVGEAQQLGGGSPLTSWPALRRDAVAPLDERHCLSLLQGATFGRLGLSVDALPVIVPVSYEVRDRRLLLAAQPFLGADVAQREPVACLQVDGRDERPGLAWTVLATGRLTSPPDTSGAATGPGPSDAAGAAWTANLVLSIALVSGQCVEVG